MVLLSALKNSQTLMGLNQNTMNDQQKNYFPSNLKKWFYDIRRNRSGKLVQLFLRKVIFKGIFLVNRRSHLVLCHLLVNILEYLIPHNIDFLLLSFSAENHSIEGSFREAVGPFLMVGQCFGVLPVIGVRSRNLSELQFKWTSIRTLCSLVCAAFLVCYTLFLGWVAFQVEVESSTIGL